MRFTHVIHAATDTSQDADAKPLELVDTIVGGTRRVLDIALASGAEDFLYVSSGAVYGGQGDFAGVFYEFLHIRFKPSKSRVFLYRNGCARCAFFITSAVVIV